MQTTRLSQQSSAYADLTFISDDNSLSYIFPLSKMDQPTSSQSFSSIIFSNQPTQEQIEAHNKKMARIRKNDAAWRAYMLKQNLTTQAILDRKPKNLTELLPMPNFHQVGGPFTGTLLKKQKIVSNNTFYFTFRDNTGQETTTSVDWAGSAKVKLDFKININDLVLSTFDQNAKTNLKCAYLPVATKTFDHFKTDKCETAMIDENNQLIYSSVRNISLFKDGKEIVAVNGQPVQKNSSKILEVLKGQKQLTVKCLCQHMSYFTLIQDLGAPEESSQPLKYDKDIKSFKDWAAFGMISYLAILFLALVFYTRSRDLEQWMALKRMEETDEEIVLPDDYSLDNVSPVNKPPQQRGALCWKSPVQRYNFTLMNMIFQRKLMIEPYCLAVEPSSTAVSTWQLYKIFMQQLHPLISIFYRFDISLPRLDRVLVLLTRILICSIISYFGVGSL